MSFAVPGDGSEDVGKGTRTALRIAVIYLLVSAAWIVFSDRLLQGIVESVGALTRLQTYKGFFFVAASTLLIFLLLRNEFCRRELAEKDTRLSNERNMALLSAIPDHIFRIRADGIIIDYRGASQTEFNQEPEQILGQSIEDLFPAPPQMKLRQTISDALQHYSMKQFAFEQNKGAGSEHFEVRMVPSGEGEVIAILRNVTELQRVAEIIRGAEHEKEIILDSLVEHVIYSNLDLEILWLNRAAQESVGRSREELIGKHCYEIWAMRDSPCPDCPVEMAMKTGAVSEKETETPDGRTWFIRGYPVHNEAGNLIGGIEVTLETTDQKLAERALAESEVRYRSLFESAKDAILLMQNDTILECNQFAAEMFVAKRQEMLGKSILDFSPSEQPDGSDSRMEALKRIDAVIAGEPQFFNWRHGRVDGSEFDAEVSLSRIEINNVVYVQAMVRDITDRTKATIALRQYADRLKLLRGVDQAILEARSAEAIVKIAVEHLRRVGVCDRASVTLIDTDAAGTRIVAVDVEGHTDLSAGSEVYFQDPRSFEKLKQGGIQVFMDLRKIAQPTSTIKTLLKEGILSYANIPLIAQGDLFGVLHIGSRKSGTFSKEELEIAQEVANVVSVAVHQASLNERVQQHAQLLEVRVEERTRELEVANLQLQDLDRMKGEFVSNVSHELRTPITNIMLYLDLFNQPGREERSQEFLEILKNEAKRLSNLIEDLLTLSRMEQSQDLLDRELHVLDAIISDVLKTQRERAKAKGIILQHEVNQSVPAIEVNRDQIIQVLTNLISNAIAYSRKEGSVQIDAVMCDYDGDKAVCVTIHNDGSYIDAEDLPHIFERFYRGKSGQESREPGTGLGLAISKEIIEQHRGKIEAESNLEAGTTFKIWLPISSRT
ncbi:MAG: PAS domain S-box protein [Anaerolineales bacterium]|nr:PAS domain S-box protein [Anaerolineales bacterium]